jgi:hypothetical protein
VGNLATGGSASGDSGRPGAAQGCAGGVQGGTGRRVSPVRGVFQFSSMGSTSLDIDPGGSVRLMRDVGTSLASAGAEGMDGRRSSERGSTGTAKDRAGPRVLAALCSKSTSNSDRCLDQSVDSESTPTPGVEPCGRYCMCDVVMCGGGGGGGGGGGVVWKYCWGVGGLDCGGQDREKSRDGGGHG